MNAEWLPVTIFHIQSRVAVKEEMERSTVKVARSKFP